MPLGIDHLGRRGVPIERRFPVKREDYAGVSRFWGTAILCFTPISCRRRETCVLSPTAPFLWNGQGHDSVKTCSSTRRCFANRAKKSRKVPYTIKGETYWPPGILFSSCQTSGALRYAQKLIGFSIWTERGTNKSRPSTNPSRVIIPSVLGRGIQRSNAKMGCD